LQRQENKQQTHISFKLKKRGGLGSSLAVAPQKKVFINTELSKTRRFIRDYFSCYELSTAAVVKLITSIKKEVNYALKFTCA